MEIFKIDQKFIEKAIEKGDIDIDQDRMDEQFDYKQKLDRINDLRIKIQNQPEILKT